MISNMLRNQDALKDKTFLYMGSGQIQPVLWVTEQELCS